MPGFLLIKLSAQRPAASDRPGSQSFFPVLVQDEDLAGIKENQGKLIGWLDTNEPNSTVITLVANVYDRVKNSFEVNAWIVVSQTYNIDALLRELLQKIGYTEKPLSVSIDKMDTYMLKLEIRSRLQEGSGRCLIVLDDVWDKGVYEKIQDVFKNLQSSRVIITTRRDVASLTSLGHHLQLQPLGKDDALRLFCARAFSNKVDRNCPPDLKKVPVQIVERFQGLPLALVSMGCLMSSKQQTDHAWNQVFNQFRSELSKTDDVQAILKLSYNVNDLPGDL
jgi:disease resistance protein RPM1